MAATRIVRLGLFRPTARFTPQLASGRRYASQDYGSGEGSPVGENPQSQGPNPSADKEHPGPPPPKAGQNTGSTPTKGTKDGHNSSQAQQSGNNSTGNKQGTQSTTNNGSSPQPKILDPSSTGGSKGEDVEAHNQKFEKRAERAGDKVSQEDVEKDKVPKKFWAGQGGRDADP